jgi:hypothetical protein
MKACPLTLKVAMHPTWTVALPKIYRSAAITSLAVTAVPSIGRIWLMKKR